MAKFTPLELQLFAETKCAGCHQPDAVMLREFNRGNGCPHLRKAMIFGKMPGVWKRKRFGSLGDTFDCAEYSESPPSTRRRSAPADTAPMFEVDEGDKRLVPVDGWPDYRAEAVKQRGGDHQ